MRATRPDVLSGQGWKAMAVAAVAGVLLALAMAHGAAAQTPPPLFPDLDVIKVAADAEVDPGETVTFTIFVSNPSPNPAAINVTLEDALPPGVPWSEDHPDCTITGTTMTCAFGDIPSGGREIVVITGETDEADCGTLLNIVTVRADNDPVPDIAGASTRVRCPRLDHFKCYRGTASADHAAAGRRVALEDQFGRSRATIAKVYNFCNPVDKNQEGIKQPEGHFVEYKLVDRVSVNGRFRKHRVRMENQFGEVTLVVQRPNRLLVPSAKALFPEVPQPLTAELDHYLCYKVHSSTAFTARWVTLTDQFVTQRVNVRKPRMLCNPVSKNDDPIFNSEEHFVCYIARASGRPGRWVVNAANQFGTTTIVTDKVRHLCVPSDKTVL